MDFSRTKTLADWLLRGNRDDIVVWIGRNGCAVHSTSAGYCIDIAPLLAHRFAAHHKLREREVREDGIILAA